MNIFLLVLQILLALHTAMGAVWKFFNAEAVVPSLKAIPHGVWLSMSVVELFCAAALVVPAFSKPLGILAPIAALLIAGEMLFMTVIDRTSAVPNNASIIYWLVVAGLCGFIAIGRFVLKPQ